MDVKASHDPYAQKVANEEAYRRLVAGSKGRGWHPRRHRPRTGVGRPEINSEEAVIKIYIELEARRQLSGLSLSKFLESARLCEIGRDAKPVRIGGPRRRTLRRLHSEGGREIASWRAIIFMWRPHPRAIEMDRLLEKRVREFRALEPADRNRELLTLNFR